jgi:hypothetical protein
MSTALFTVEITTKKGEEKKVIFPLDKDLYKAIMSIEDRTQRKKFFADYYYDYVSESKYERKMYERS